MSRWSDYYLQEIADAGGLESFLKGKILEKTVLLNKIQKHAPRGVVMEVGCGTGVISSYLAGRGYDVIAVDVCPDMLGLAEAIARSYGVRVDFRQADLLEITLDVQVEVAFNHGVMEHFTDPQLKILFGNIMTMAERMVFSVPSNHFTEDQKVFGDERLMEIRQWECILRSNGFDIVDRFGYYFQNRLHGFLYHLFKDRMMKHAHYIGFVIQKGQDA